MEILYLMIKNPVILISLVALIIFKIFPPKSINSWYGYRTIKSMKSDQKWSFAQNYSANIGLVVVVLALLIQLSLYLILGKKSLTDLLTLGVWLLSMGFIIFKTERKLSQFDD
ncbi:MAG: SdpI family protein [Bacteroidota bacterium]